MPSKLAGEQQLRSSTRAVRRGGVRSRAGPTEAWAKFDRAASQLCPPAVPTRLATCPIAKCKAFPPRHNVGRTQTAKATMWSDRTPTAPTGDDGEALRWQSKPSSVEYRASSVETGSACLAQSKLNRLSAHTDTVLIKRLRCRHVCVWGRLCKEQGSGWEPGWISTSCGVVRMTAALISATSRRVTGEEQAGTHRSSVPSFAVNSTLLFCSRRVWDPTLTLPTMAFPRWHLCSPTGQLLPSATVQYKNCGDEYSRTHLEGLGRRAAGLPLDQSQFISPLVTCRHP